MAKRSSIQQLNDALEEILANPNAFPSSVDPEISALLSIATDLRHLPTQEFREELKARLMRAAKSSEQKGEEIMTTAVQQKTIAIPYLSVRNAAAAIDFYKNAFGAEVIFRLDEPDGRIGHAQIRIGDAEIMLADEYPEYGMVGPQTIGGSGVTIHLSVENADAFVNRAAAAGATIVKPVQDEFYGERSGRIQDPFGHKWSVSQTIEELSEEEVQRRYNEMLKESPHPPKKVNPIREGFHTVTPYLIVNNAEAMIDFVKAAFNAVELFRSPGSAGGIHAEVEIGNSRVMIGGSAKIPIEMTHSTLYLYVENVDELYSQAVKAGGIGIQEPTDQPYGDRNAHIKDPFGNSWYIASHIKDVEP
jgi:PhnB protein